MANTFKNGDWVISKRSQMVAQIVSIDYLKKEYYVEYAHQHGQSLINYDISSFDQHWELYSSKPVNQVYKKSVCDCGTVATYGQNAPRSFHSSWCTLINGGK